MTNEEHTAYFNRSKRENSRVGDSRRSQRREIINKEPNLCSRRNIYLRLSVENNLTARVRKGRVGPINPHRLYAWCCAVVHYCEHPIMATKARMNKVTFFTRSLTRFRTSEPHFILPLDLAVGSLRPQSPRAQVQETFLKISFSILCSCIFNQSNPL